MATQGVGRDSLGASTLTLGLANCPPLVSTSGVSALFAYATILVYPLHQTVTTDSASYHRCPPTLRVLGAFRQVSAFLEGTANRNSETLLATPSSSRSQLVRQEPGASVHIPLSLRLLLRRTLARVQYISASVGTQAFLGNTCCLHLTSPHTRSHVRSSAPTNTSKMSRKESLPTCRPFLVETLTT